MLKFAKKDPLKVAEKERMLKEAQTAHDAAIGAAQACLGSELFKEYKKHYQAMEKTFIDELIKIDATEFDPVMYGFKVKDVVSAMRHTGVLLRGVEAGAGKR